MQETKSIHTFSTLMFRQLLVPLIVTLIAPPPTNLVATCLTCQLIYPLFVLGSGMPSEVEMVMAQYPDPQEQES
jgi:hypothetical protein